MPGSVRACLCQPPPASGRHVHMHAAVGVGARPTRVASLGGRAPFPDQAWEGVRAKRPLSPIFAVLHGKRCSKHGRRSRRGAVRDQPSEPDDVRGREPVLNPGRQPVNKPSSTHTTSGGASLDFVSSSTRTARRQRMRTYAPWDVRAGQRPDANWPLLMNHGATRVRSTDGFQRDGDGEPKPRLPRL